MSNFYRNNKKALDKLFMVVGIILTVFVFFKYLFTYVSPFFLGLVIALIMEPPVRLFTEKFRIKRGLAAFIGLILFLTVISTLGTMLVNKLVKEASAFAVEAPAIIREYSMKLDDWTKRLSKLTDNLPESMQLDTQSIADTLIAMIFNMFGNGFRNTSYKLATNVPMFLLSLLITLVSAFFYMKDRELIFKTVSGHCPKWLAYNLSLMWGGISRAARGYFKAQFIIMSIIGIISITGLLILRNPYALLVGLLLAVFDFLPMLGTGTILVPWSLSALMAGNYSLGIGILVLYGVNIIARQTLEPKILGEQIGLHPLLTLMSLFIGLKIFGFFGIIIGPSLVIILKAIYEAE